MTFPYLKPLRLRTDLKLEYPDGSTEDVSTSTTGGWQQLSDRAQQYGLDMHVDGGTDQRNQPPTGASFVYFSNESINLPAIQGRRLTTDSVTLNFSTSVGVGHGLKIDSMMMGLIEIRGQIVYSGQGTPVVICPVNPVPIDQMITVVDSRISIQAISNSTNPAGGSSLAINCDLGAFTNNIVEINEINRGTYAMLVQDGTYPVARNIFRLPHLHSNNGCALRAGNTSRQNMWFVNAEPEAGGIGIKTAGQKDQFFGCANPSFGPLSFAVYFEPPAANNRLRGDWAGPIQGNGNPSNVVEQL